MNLRKINEEVFVADGSIVQVGSDEIEFLKQQAMKSPRKRARICAHRSDDDPLHEMIIAMSSETYIRPHRHVGKSESFHIVEGEVDVVFFDESGEIGDIVELGEPHSQRKFYYRLDDSAYHTLLIRTKFLVVQEVTNGPFDRSRTIEALFAPSEDDALSAREYIRSVADRLARARGGDA